MTPTADEDLVHAPLARWARLHPDAIAIDDGHQKLTFAALHDAAQQVSCALSLAHAPGTVMVDDHLPTLRRVVDFLGIIASGRCAAVGDADWTDGIRAAVIDSLATQTSASSILTATSPFYIGFTSGSTGRPKGFRRHHRSWTESFRVCVKTFGPDAASCILVPGRISHSLFLFGMLLGLWSGAGVIVQEQFSAARALDTLRQGRAPCLVAVPSQLVMMMALAARRRLAPIAEVRLILISGARWMRERTPELKALFPCARVVEFYGASETSFVAWMDADETASDIAVGHPFDNVEIAIRDQSGPAEAGLVFVRSPMLFMDYVGGGADATAALRDADWLSVGDMGYLDAQGRLCLMGRQNRMIVTQGKNLFPEELESVLAACPGIAGVSVHGWPHPVRGQEVVAIVHRPKLGPALDPAAASQLSNWCREHLEAFKVPRHYYVCDEWPLTASGKADHHRLGMALRCHMDRIEDGSLPCLHPLR